MKRLILTIIFATLAVPGYSQTLSYELNISGAASSVYPFTSVQCNQSTLPGSSGTINPRYLVWDDPSNSNRYCVHDTGAGTGPLFALPIGDYSANLVAINSTPTAVLRSEPSNTATFSRLTPPAVRTGFRVRGVL